MHSDARCISGYRLYRQTSSCPPQGNIPNNIDVILSAMAYQITSLTIVWWTVYSDADQRKYQSTASLAFVRGTHRWPVNFPRKGRATGICFHLMTSSLSLCAISVWKSDRKCKYIFMFPIISSARHELTQWGRDKMAANFLTTFSYAISWIQIYKVRLIFHWSLFSRDQLSTFQHWLKKWLGAGMTTSHPLNQWCLP